MSKTAYQLSQLGVDGLTAEHVEATLTYLRQARVGVAGTAQWLRDVRVDPQLAVKMARAAWWMNPAIPQRYRRLLDARAEKPKMQSASVASLGGEPKVIKETA